MPNRLLRAIIVLSAALTPPGVAAQQERSSTVPRYHLMQLSVETEADGLEKFKAKAEAIRSCNDAQDVAKSLGAQVTRNRLVSASNLPADIQDILLKLPVGHATPVFTGDGAMLRVLVLCGRI